MAHGTVIEHQRRLREVFRHRQDVRSRHIDASAGTFAREAVSRFQSGFKAPAASDPHRASRDWHRSDGALDARAITVNARTVRNWRDTTSLIRSHLLRTSVSGCIRNREVTV